MSGLVSVQYYNPSTREQECVASMSFSGLAKYLESILLVVTSIKVGLEYTNWA